LRLGLKTDSEKKNIPARAASIASEKIWTFDVYTIRARDNFALLQQGG
jgi:hypothetical protein